MELFILLLRGDHKNLKITKVFQKMSFSHYTNIIFWFCRLYAALYFIDKKQPVCTLSSKSIKPMF